MTDLTEMATFAEEVERGSFTAAAEALGVSKGFVSKLGYSLPPRPVPSAPISIPQPNAPSLVMLGNA